MLKNKLLPLLIFSILLSCLPATAQDKADFYVAVNGNDAWSGILTAPNEGKTDGPFATLDRARNAVRAKKKNGGAIFVREGTYYLKDVFWLEPEDSGTSFLAYPGEKPVLSGGTVITGEWRKTEDNKKWRLQLSKGMRVDDLFINGRRQQRARIPKTGFLKALAAGESKTEFKFEKGTLAGWPDASSGEAVIMPYEWVDFHLPVAKIDEQKCIVTLAKPCGYPLVPAGWGPHGDFYIENVLTALDSPGEWCFNKETSILYLIPPGGTDPNKCEITCGRLSVMFALEGQVNKKKWVENISFRGLTFQHSGREGRWRNYEGTAIRLSSGVRNCSVEDSRFLDLGGSGVVIWKGCLNNTVSGCEFTRTGDTPVYINDYPEEGQPTSANNQITDNYIHHCNTVMKSISGITVSGSEGNRIAHNVITDMPYIGINLSGALSSGWNQQSTPELQPPFTAAKIKPYVRSRNNVFEFNCIHDVMQELHDGGGIYFWGTLGQGPNIIRNNLIYNVGAGRGTAVGIYLDDETNDVRVYNNVVYGANLGVHLHGCPGNVLENNVFAYSGLADISIQPEAYNIGPMNTSFCRNVMYMGFGKMFESGETWSKTWDRKPIGEMDHNIYWRGGQKVNLGFGHLEGFDKNSSIADPFLEKPAGDSFTVKFGGEAARLGIKPIELKGIGLSRASIWTEKAGKCGGVNFPLSEEQIKALSIMRELGK